MSTTRKSILKHCAAAVIAVLVTSGRKVYAQAHDFGQPHSQRHEKADFKDHQREERRDYGTGIVREHQREEKRAFKYEERQERRRTHGGSYAGYGYPSHGRGHHSYVSGLTSPWVYGYPSGQMHGHNAGAYRGNEPFWGGRRRH
jgi:hypothetical protein